MLGQIPAFGSKWNAGIRVPGGCLLNRTEDFSICDGMEREDEEEGGAKGN